ncbi:histidine kinase [Luteococcus sp. H138]|uniref:sensor histidine kinase n=1 Tax=unclassified Luteococcus TaxID=2639923 RepID=UPI00313D2BF2
MDRESGTMTALTRNHVPSGTKRSPSTKLAGPVRSLTWHTKAFSGIGGALLLADLVMLSQGIHVFNVLSMLTLTAALALFKQRLPIAVALLTSASMLQACIPVGKLGMAAYGWILLVAEVAALGNRFSLAGAFACSFSLSLWESRRAGSVGDWATASLVFLFIYAAAALLGMIIHKRDVTAEEMTTARLTAQRREIAGELHDTVVHEVTMLVLEAERGQSRPAEARQLLSTIATSGRRINTQLRQMMNLLELDLPPERMDLSEMIEHIQEQFSRVERPLNVSVSGPIDSFTPAINDSLARVVREGANNILRHGDPRGASAIMVAVQEQRVDILMTNAMRPGHDERNSGLGLIGMRQRMASIGGTVENYEDGVTWSLRGSAPRTSGAALNS